jgi:pilus assembly protein CpaB
MNRRTRHLVVLCVAVITASLASFGVYRAVERLPVHQVDQTPVSVAVAAKSMPLGTRIGAHDVKLVAWPANNPLPGAIAATEAVIGRALLTSVLENEPLTAAKLASADAGAGLPPAIPQGMRAISVKVNDVIGVAGFVEPGSHVDLLVTIRRRDDGITRTVASNVRVLTSGTRQDQAKTGSGTDAKSASTVVTLMVPPDDAERIALAQSEGQIMLVLRNPLDKEQTVTSGVRTASLLGPAEVTPEKPVAAPRPAVVRKPVPVVDAPPPPAPPRVVEAIRAAKRTEEVIR